MYFISKSKQQLFHILTDLNDSKTIKYIHTNTGLTSVILKPLLDIALVGQQTDLLYQHKTMLQFYVKYISC